MGRPGYIWCDLKVYQHRAVVSTSAGSTSTTSLNVLGGLCRQVYIAANTSSTVFLANLQDESNLKVMDWGTHTGVLNDIRIALPMAGKYTLNITNASPNDIFNVLMAVEE